MPHGPSDLDILCGYVFGGTEKPLPAERRSPLDVMESQVLEALQYTPCLVAFSGGRDSSAVLAFAARVAHRHGLPEPIPITRRYPGIQEAEESVYQEQVLRHLALDDWQRIEITDELDAVGPVATQLMRRIEGPLWPPVIHQVLPVLEAARGGALIGGEGGDTAFGPTRASVAVRVATRRLRRSPVTFRQIAQDLAPRPARKRLLAHGIRLEFERPWLTPDAAAAVFETQLRHALSEPLGWRKAQSWHLGSRSNAVGAWLIDDMAAAHDVRRFEPFTSPSFISALGNTVSTLGFTSRREAMSALFGHLIPDTIWRRTSKADFARAIFGPHTRRFAATWDGTTRFKDALDPERLRSEWLSEPPAVSSLLLLYHAWWENEQRTRSEA